MVEIKIQHPAKWPKKAPELTVQQAAISDDFMKYWHEVLSSRYGLVEKFSHRYVVRGASQGFTRTLEIGAGSGEHLKYEKLSPEQRRGYVAVDMRENMIAEFHRRFPDIHAVVGDCQKRMDFQDGSFDRLVAIHVLEHLPDLPAAVREMYRLCNKDHGVLSIVIPCEGGLAYSLARQISAQRIFEARYKQSYRWFIEREHLNRSHEIFEELVPLFSLVSSTYFPIALKAEFCNLCIGATLKPKPTT